VLKYAAVQERWGVTILIANAFKCHLIVHIAKQNALSCSKQAVSRFGAPAVYRCSCIRAPRAEGTDLNRVLYPLSFLHKSDFSFLISALSFTGADCGRHRLASRLPAGWDAALAQAAVGARHSGTGTRSSFLLGLGSHRIQWVW